MPTVEVQIPDDTMELLKRSRLGTRPVAEQLRIALAIQLLQEGLISAGKAASLAGEPRASFELLLGEMGIPVVRYALKDYEEDLAAFERAREKDA